MAINRKYFGILAVVLILVTVYVGAAGLTVNPDGTLGPIDVAGNVTATGHIQAQAGFGYVPIGTILPWYDLAGTMALPAGWYKCDGTTVSNLPSGSPGDLLDVTANGTFVTPNLNANVRDSLAARGVFLRGGTTAGTFQGDAFQGHWHSLSAGTTAGSQLNFKGEYVLSQLSAGGSRVDIVGNKATNATSDDHPNNGTPRTTNETRPLNMSVVWIIRVQ